MKARPEQFPAGLKSVRHGEIAGPLGDRIILESRTVPGPVQAILLPRVAVPLRDQLPHRWQPDAVVHRAAASA